MRSLAGAIVVVLGAVSMACSDGRTPARDTAPTIKPQRGAEGPGGASGEAGAPASGGRRTVIFLGTSLTAGLGLDPDSAYPQRIQRKIDASSLPYQVVNAGVSGETSAGLLRRLDWVLQREADVIVVETGANDGLRGLPVASTKATIAEILTRIRRERPNARLVLAQMEAPTNLGQEYTSAFHQMFVALAGEHDAVLLPFLLDGVAGHRDLNQPDGVHPNDAGVQLVAENVWRGLRPVLSLPAASASPATAAPVAAP